MYVGFAAGWIGLWVVFGHANPIAIATVAAVALGCICLWSSMKRERCTMSSVRTMTNIAETVVAGGRAREAGASHSSCGDI
jgi:hypothetical protein